MAGGIVNVILRCIRQGSGMSDFAAETEKALGDTKDMSKAMLSLGMASAGVGKVIKSVMTGGMWEIGAQAVNYISEKWQELRQRAVEAEKAFGNAFKNAAEASERNFKRVVDAISSASTRAKELLTLSGARGGVALADEARSVNVRARNAMAAAKNESEKAIIKADAQLAVARLNEAEQGKRASANVRAAKRELARAEDRLDAAESALDVAKRRERDAEARATAALKSDNDDKIKVANENHYKAIEARQKAEERVAAEEDKVASAENALRIASAKATEARILASEATEAARIEALETRKKAKDAEEKKAEADRIKAEKEREAAEMIQREIDEEDAAFEARQNLIESYDALAEQGRKELRELAPRAKRLDAQIDELTLRLKKAQEGIARTGRGQAADAAHTNGLFGPYQYGGRANGGENFTDWQRAQRFAERGDRDAEKVARRDAASQRRYARLADEQRRGRRLSTGDKRFMRDWENFQDQKGGAAALQQRLEAAQKARDQLQKDIDKTLKSIDQNIKDALALA